MFYIRNVNFDLVGGGGEINLRGVGNPCAPESPPSKKIPIHCNISFIHCTSIILYHQNHAFRSLDHAQRMHKVVIYSSGD